MGPSRRTLIRALTWPLTPVLLAASVALDLVTGTSPSLPASYVPVLLAGITCWLVGVVVTGRSFSQGAGWAFLGLSTAMAWSAVTDEYVAPVTDRAAGADPLPGTDVFAVLSDSSFVWWFVCLALVLQLTPPGPREGRLAVWLPRVTVACGVVFQVMALLRSRHLDPPLEDFVSPFAVQRLAGPIGTLATISIYLLGLCLVTSVFVLVGSWRRATGDARRQLLWLAAGATPVAPAVVAAFALSSADRYDLAATVLGLAVVSLVVGAAFSVLRYRLYDVERVVTESAAYAIASVSIAAIFAAVVLVVTRSTPVDSSSPAVTIAATLAGVAVGRASYVWGRRAVGRRVNRTLFDAVEAVRSDLAEPTVDLDRVMAEVLGQDVRLVYPLSEGGWVTSGGQWVEPRGSWVDVHRRGARIARVEFDPGQHDRDVIEAVAGAAAAEIDNVALRAELARQVQEVTESRARLETAHLRERRRIERDLHDGAQQRLLALALELQTARLNGDPARMRRALADGSESARAAVRDLRALANGLHPAALADGGLPAALDDLARHSPVPLQLHVECGRLDPGTEFTAWSVIGEAVVNAQKHAAAHAIAVDVARENGRLHLSVRDDGRGGANPDGPGLRGLRDRVETAHGRLSVSSGPGGTTLEAVLPCEDARPSRPQEPPCAS
ncbi:MAG TPA: histidine kinase [Nocardioides sp.]|nr:histidine kinase [Nocardioides sp.]